MVQNLKDKNSLDIIEEVTILLVGDPGVGKTSLIHSYVESIYNPNLPARIPTVTLSANVTPNHVPLKIVDYSEREQTSKDLEPLVQEANVICIVCLAGDAYSFRRVKTHWLKVIRQYQTSVVDKCKPIIVAANKSDLIYETELTSKIPALLQELEDIEASIDVSALTRKNVVELFYLAQKSVLYPLAPIFDSQLRILTKECRSALINIFKLCDIDQDGLLSDHELQLFHENCFGIPLQNDALDDLKSIIKQSTMDGILDNCITQSGFLFLHTFSIDKGRHAFTWRVLRKFNYDNQMNIIICELNDSSEKVATDTANGGIFSIQAEGFSQSKPNKRPTSEEIQHASHLDLSWVRENPKIIRAGFGLTVAVISMLALKYLVQSSSRGSV